MSKSHGATTNGMKKIQADPRQLGLLSFPGHLTVQDLFLPFEDIFGLIFGGES